MSGLNILLFIALLSLILGGCDGSEVYYTIDGEKIPSAPIGGKGDAPIGVPTDLPLAPEVLRFPQDGSPLTLDAAQISTFLGQSGATIKHSKPLQGLVISWDGSNSAVYARSRSGLAQGVWSQAESLVEQESSFRVRFETLFAAEAIDLYFMTPEGVSFMIIEPVMP